MGRKKTLFIKERRILEAMRDYQTGDFKEFDVSFSKKDIRFLKEMFAFYDKDDKESRELSIGWLNQILEEDAIHEPTV